MGYDNSKSTASGQFPITIDVKERDWELAEYHGGPQDGEVDYAKEPSATVNGTLLVKGTYYHGKVY